MCLSVLAGDCFVLLSGQVSPFIRPQLMRLWLLLASLSHLASATQAAVKGVALVTGATDGIGQLTASLLSREGFTLLLHGRSHDRLQSTCDRILKETPSAVLETFCYDISSISATKALAEDVISRHSRLDIVVQNAGVFMKDLVITSDGMEKTFATNVAAPYVLSSMLMPLLLTTPQSRMLMVSSISQSDGGGRMDLQNLQMEKDFDCYRSYGQSKLYMAMMAQELAERYSPEECLVMSCDPGTVNTKMLLSGWGRCGINVSDATDEFHLVKSYDAGRHGGYFVGCRESRSCADAYDREKRSALLAALHRLTGCSW